MDEEASGQRERGKIGNRGVGDRMNVTKAKEILMNEANHNNGAYGFLQVDRASGYLECYSQVLPLLNKIIIPIQKSVYRYFYKKAVQKWPHLYDEIVCTADWGELFEGYLPGYKHSDYWKEVK